MALMSSMMPGEVLVFLRQILNVVRLLLSGPATDSDTALNEVYKAAGYSEKTIPANMSTTMVVVLITFTVIATLLVLVDFLVIRRNNVQVPQVLRQFMTSFLNFTIFYYGYCLLEITLCAMVQIKAGEATAGAWLVLLLTYVPFVYVGSLLWKFTERFNSPNPADF